MQPSSPYQPPPYQSPQQQAPQAPPGYGGGGYGGYAAPATPALYRQNVFVPPGASTVPLLGPGIRKAKLAIGIAQVVTMLAAFAFFIIGAVLGPDDSGGPFMILGGLLFGLWYLGIMAYGILSLVWMYKFWSWIPPEQRHTPLWKKYISPGIALGYMFIPYFNIYWMFVVYLGIADIMERLRVQFPTQKGPVKNLALMRLIVPMVFFPAGPFLDYYFDKHVEEMATDMQARMQGGITPNY